MQQANNFIVLNIREYLENEDKRLGEEILVQLLSEFSCPFRRLRNATSRINTAYFLLQNKTTPHWFMVK